MWEQRYAPRDPCVPEARTGARAEALQESLFRVVLRDVLGWGLPRGILRLCGIKGVQASGIAPVSKEYGKSQRLRALCFSLSRYRLNRLSLLCSESGSPRSPQIPPRPESEHGLPPRCFQRCRWLLVIVSQSTGLGGRTRAAAASEAPATFSRFRVVICSV